MKDKIFDKKIKKSFEFDDDVASVFDDMLSRSVPFYKEAQSLTKKMALLYIKNNTNLYDLGSSTATLLLEIERDCKKDVKLIGIDNSKAMLKYANKKIVLFNSNVEVNEGDILEYDYTNASVILSNYTLQFIRPIQREKLIQKIYNSLNDDGVFIFSEKVIVEDKVLNKELIDIYYEFKKDQGYSEYEIMQKREALENVLIPYTVEENTKIIKDAGFKTCEVIFRWANFVTFIAKK